MILLMSKTKIILMYCSLALLVVLFTSSYGSSSNQYLKKLPSYFDKDTWQEIDKQNSLSRMVEKIAVVVDGPVEYIKPLVGKKYSKNIGKYDEVINNKKVLDPVHGTAVAGLMVGDVSELPCTDGRNKKCTKSKIYTAGIARNVKLLSFPYYSDSEDNEKALENLGEITKKLAAKKAYSKVQRDFPAKMILNFSVGLDQLLQGHFKSIKEAFEEQKNFLEENKTVSPDKANRINYLKKEIELYEWYLEYLKDKANWKIPDKTKREKWDDFRYERDKESAKIVQDVNISYEALMDDSGLLSAVDKLVIVAAGNESRELPYTGEGLTAKRVYGKSIDPVIRVSASCDNNKKLCGFSNYGKSLIDIAAPGAGIAVMTYIIDKVTGNKKPYATYMDGTSFSAPLVSGILLLLSACKPTATISELKETLFNNAVIVGGLKGYVIDGRTLDVKSALKFCKQEISPHMQKPKLSGKKPKDEL